jgi:hypothetical protein
MNPPSRPNTLAKRGWDFFRNEGRIGTGDWNVFHAHRLPEIQRAAETWRAALTDVRRPWLCWSVDPAWCYVQQQLVVQAGWTPVVGTDGVGPPPPLVDEAVFIDFNAQLRLPAMWMHFVLEFAFLISERLAFWHSDVLPPLSVMRALADQFEGLRDGEMVATAKKLSVLYVIRRLLRRKRVRGVSGWTEIVGCTTRGASASQFSHGCGWWRGLPRHPNASPEVLRQRPYWEHGVGIRHWQRLFQGNVTETCVDVSPFHYSRAGRAAPRYRREMVGGQQFGSKVSELSTNFNLEQIIGTLECPIRLPDA